MRFIFSAPFRTNINLNSLMAMSNPDIVFKIINNTISSFTEFLPEGIRIKNQWKKHDNGELHYSSLDEDLIPLSAMPLFVFAVSPEIILSEIVKTLPIIGKSSIINNCEIEYFNNTIAILRLDIKIEKPENGTQILSFIDKWSTELCSKIIFYVKETEYSFHRKINKDRSYNIANKLFKDVGSFNVFIDRNELDIEETKSREELLWVTRTLFCEKDNTLTSSLEDWTQQPLLTSKKVAVGKAHIAFCIGNNVVFGSLSSKEEYAFLTSMSVCSYFYGLNDVINMNLKNIFLKIFCIEKTKLSYFKTVNKIRNHIVYIENEFSDVLRGLQGTSKLCADHFLSTWEYDKLIDSVQNKKDAVGQAVDLAFREKQDKYSRLLEVVLAAIGGIAVLDFSLNLVAFSKNEELSQDSIIGLVDAARIASADGMLYSIIIIISVIFAFALYRK